MDEDDEVRITLRLPVGLRDDLKGVADHDGRSMNSEIVARLEDSLYQDIDAQFVRGIQIATVEFLLATEDPIKALHELRATLRRPVQLSRDGKKPD